MLSTAGACAVTQGSAPRGVGETREMEYLPMPQAATIKSLPVAFRMLNAGQVEGVEWGEDDREVPAQALVEVPEYRIGCRTSPTPLA